MDRLEGEFAHLAKLAVAQRHDDVLAMLKRTAHVFMKTSPDLASELQAILRTAAASSPFRSAAVNPLPVDNDSRLELLRREAPAVLEIDPVWAGPVAEQLHAIVAERRRERDLYAHGLVPTRSMLFTGPPGVGKTLAARWLAVQLERPLLILDLAAVMSSFLGRTGNNVRTVLDYARKTPCILLLDEFDAIAKRRDDISEIGELKRLVTVLLQTIDDWPAEGILIAATNHPELLDPAVWRRFERIVEFPKPGLKEASEAILRFLGPDAQDMTNWARPLAMAMRDCSFADVERQIKIVRRSSVINGIEMGQALADLAKSFFKAGNKKEQVDFACALAEASGSQRMASKLTGVSRDTIRKKGAFIIEERDED